MRKKEIIYEIERKTANYFVWTIGIADDPDDRKKEYEARGEAVKFWEQWEADSEDEGIDIKNYFLDKGLRDGKEGDKGSKFVYVFFQ